MNKVFNFKTTLQRPEGIGTWHYVSNESQPLNLNQPKQR
jgi:hypothetical protein